MLRPLRRSPHAGCTYRHQTREDRPKEIRSGHREFRCSWRNWLRHFPVPIGPRSQRLETNSLPSVGWYWSPKITHLRTRELWRIESDRLLIGPPNGALCPAWAECEVAHLNKGDSYLLDQSDRHGPLSDEAPHPSSASYSGCQQAFAVATAEFFEPVVKCVCRFLPVPRPRWIRKVPPRFSQSEKRPREGRILPLREILRWKFYPGFAKDSWIF